MLNRHRLCLLASLVIAMQGCLASSNTETATEAASAGACAFEDTLTTNTGPGVISGSVGLSSELYLFNASGDLYLSVTDAEDAQDGVADDAVAIVVLRDVDLSDGQTVDYAIEDLGVDVGPFTVGTYSVVPFLDVNRDACQAATPGADACDYVSEPVESVHLTVDSPEASLDIDLSLNGAEARNAGNGEGISDCNVNIQLPNL